MPEKLLPEILLCVYIIWAMKQSYVNGKVFLSTNDAGIFQSIK